MDTRRAKSVGTGAAVVAALIVVVLVLSRSDKAEPPEIADAAAVADGRSNAPVRTNNGSGAANVVIEDRDRADESAAGDDGATSDPAGSDTTPIPLGPEFAAILERNGEFAELHRIIESEPWDPVWGAQLERYLEDNFIAALDPALVRLESLECRSASCEILAIGYGNESMSNWMQSFSGLVEQEEDIEALFGGPGTAGCSVHDVAPDVYALSCMLRRTEGEPVVESDDVFPIDTPYPAGADVDPVAVPEVVVSAIETSLEVFELHRRLEQEPTDAGWANYIEPLLSQYLGSNPQMQSIDVVDIVCRTTLCEVQMTVNGSEDEMMTWMTVMFDFQQQGWHDMTTAGMNTGEAAEGEPFGFVWILERRIP